MTNSILKNKMMGVLLLAVLSLSACGKKDGSGVRVAGRGAATGVAQGGTTGTSGTCGAQSTGKIFDAYASSTFEQQVKNFVSATLDPQSLGSISGNINDKTGIDFNATFRFDSNGNVVAAESKVHIKIFDSFVGQVYNGQTIQPYEVAFTAASEGMIDRNTRQFQVRFKDSYGEIVFQGSYDNSLAQGTVYYQNYTAVQGYQPTSGTLGSFRIYACSLIK